MSFQRLSEGVEGKSRPGGRSFHSRGPAAEKLLSPSLLCVRGTSSFRMSLELDRSGRRPTSDRRRQSPPRSRIYQVTPICTPTSNTWPPTCPPLKRHLDPFIRFRMVHAWLLCPRRRGALSDTAIRPSVCPSPIGAQLP